VDITGKIVILCEASLGFSHFWLGLYAQEAAERGAIGKIVIHLFPWPYRMSMEAGNINIERGFVERQVPPASISALDALVLMRHLGEGKTRAFIKVDSALPDVDSTVLGGVIQGSRWPDERVAVIGHLDAGYPPGANDNGSSLGCILVIAGVLGKRCPLRTIEIICSVAEEGVSPRALQYVQRHKDRLKNMKAIANMDMFGAGGQPHFVEIGEWNDCGPIQFSEWLMEALETSADEMGYYVSRMTAGSTSEEARFLQAGVPATWIWKPDDMYYHSAEDTPDKIDANGLKAVADITAITVWRLANQHGTS
jgi:aminopeptidase YwaD